MQDVMPGKANRYERPEAVSWRGEYFDRSELASNTASHSTEWLGPSFDGGGERQPAFSSIVDLFESQSRLRPDAIAVASRRHTVTYAALHGMTVQIARYLRRVGVAAESLVAVYLERSPDLIATLMGIWKSGGAYLPIDPGNPGGRVTLLLEDSEAPFVLTQRSLLDSLPATSAKVICIEDIWSEDTEVGWFEPSQVTANQLAYVIYTSGTTGKPKGAEICHANLLNVIQSIGADLALQPKDVVLATATIAFDVSSLEIYVPLIAGATIRLMEQDLAADGRQVIEAIRECDPALVLGTPTFWRLLLEAGWEGDPKLQIIVGGEVLPLSLGRRLAEITRTVWNQYGPTETSICATRERVLPDADRITLGVPIANVHIYILDEYLRPMAAGDAGQIYIGGAGVGRGYLRRPELTAMAFLPDSFNSRPGAMMYKTGDLGRLLPDGRLDFLGRIDNQVKLRGFRIELEEIEAEIRAHSGVHTACVQLVEYGPDDQRLIAYFRGARELSTTQLREFLRQRLPAYMLPSEFIPLDWVPMTVNGKIDRKALDAIRIEFEGRPSIGTGEAAGDSQQAQIGAIWQKHLKVRSIGSSDNFFDLGGHSLLAARMCAEIERMIGRNIPLSTLIENPSLGRFAASIHDLPQGDWPGLVPIRTTPGAPSLFIAHGLGSNLLLFRTLAEELDGNYSVYGIQLTAAPNAALNELSLEAFAARYVEAILQVDPTGPYYLAGHSLGGLLAFEIASQLRAAGREVQLLALLDAKFRGPLRFESAAAEQKAAFENAVRHWHKKLSRLAAGGMVDAVRRKVLYNKLMFKVWALRKTYREGSFHPQIFGLDPYIALFAERYYPQPVEVDAVLFSAEDQLSPESVVQGWSQVIRGRVEVQRVPGSHQTIFTRPHVSVLARELARRLL